MGLKTGNASGTYLRFKEGKFYRSTDKEKSEPFTEIEGEIISIAMGEDEWEGNPIKKLNIRMTDGEETFMLGLSFDSSYASGLIGFLKNADLSQPLSLVGTFKEGKDGKRRPGILVKQNDEWVKAAYTKDNPNGLPPMVKKRSGKWDKDDMSDFLENVVTEELAPKVSKTKPAQKAEPVRAAVNKEAVTNDGEDVPDEDESLPF